MNEIQILGLVATVLGIITAVFNLVAFIREKDRAHLRAGIVAVLGLGLIVGVLAFPHLAPGPARRLAAALPSSLKPWLGSWLAPDSRGSAASPQEAPSAPPPASPGAPGTTASAATPGLQGTCQVEIRRNLLGGIDTVVAVFRFADLSNRGGRVLSYQLKLQATPGGDIESFYAVLEAPIVVAPGGTAKAEIPLNGPARESWLARHKEKSRGHGEIKWQGLDGDGRKVELASPLPD